MNLCFTGMFDWTKTITSPSYIISGSLAHTTYFLLEISNHYYSLKEILAGLLKNYLTGFFFIPRTHPHENNQNVNQG